MGPTEILVLQAWGTGIRIDAKDRGVPEAQATALLQLLEAAKALDAPKGQAKPPENPQNLSDLQRAFLNLGTAVDSFVTKDEMGEAFCERVDEIGGVASHLISLVHQEQQRRDPR